MARKKHPISRRRFLEGTGAALAAATAAPALAAQRPTLPPAPTPLRQAARTRIRLTINGVAQRIEVEDRWTLVEVLRDHVGLTGTKIGCDRGECGACTVLLDGQPVYSCSQLAVWADGRSVQTVEGLARNGRLSPLQQAFVDHDAPQCGFCTSGQLMAATALLARNPRPSAPEVRAGDDRQPVPLFELQRDRRGGPRRVGAAHSRQPERRRAMSAQSAKPIEPLKTVGRTTRGSTPSNVSPARRPTRATSACRACCTRASCAVRIRTPASAASIRRRRASLPGVKAVLTHDNAPVWWGAGSIAGGAQYNDDIKKITTQRRYIFNNPVRFVGDAVAAVAAVDRHVAEEALASHRRRLRSAAVRRSIPKRRSSRMRRKIWPEGNLSPNARNEAVPSQPRRGQRRRGLRARPTRSSKIATPPRSCTTPRWSRAPAVAHWEGDKLTRLHADRRHRQLPARHRARSRPPRRQGAHRLPVHGRQLRQQEPEPGRRPDCGDAGEARPAHR